MSRDLPASWNLDSGRMEFVVIAEFSASEHVVRSGRIWLVMISEFLTGDNFVQCGLSREPPKVSKRKDGKTKLKPNTGTSAGVRSKVLFSGFVSDCIAGNRVEQSIQNVQMSVWHCLAVGAQIPTLPCFCTCFDGSSMYITAIGGETAPRPKLILVA